MTMIRSRFVSLLLVLCLLITLIPFGVMFSSASAEDIYGMTTDKDVWLRQKASVKADGWFQMPANWVCAIIGEKDANGIHWYNVVSFNPESKSKSKTYTGYVHGSFFRKLTDEETTQYKSTSRVVTSVTATPIPAGSTQVPSSNTKVADGTTGTITNSGVNFREQPSTDSHSMTKLDRGTVVSLLSVPNVIDENNWYQIRYEGIVGYIQAPFIRVNGFVVTPAPATATPAGATPTPTPAVTAAPTSSGDYSYVKLILTSCHLRTSPAGDYDSDNDWEGQYSTLPLNGKAVKKGNYTWYPVLKNGRTYYVRNDCVQVVAGKTTPTPGPADPTATPVSPTATPAPANVLGYVKTIAGGCNLRATADGTVITQIKKNVVLPYLLQPVTKNGHTWYYVQYGDKRGYLRGDVVKTVNKDGTVTPTPAPTVTPTPDPSVTYSDYVQTVMDKVFIRESASRSGNVAGNVALGTVLRYTGKTVSAGVTWYKVIYAGQNRWIMGSCVKVMTQAEYDAYAGSHSTTPEPIIDATGYIKTTASGVNLRKKASTGSDMLGQVNKNTVLPYIGTPQVVGKVTWYHVKHPTLGEGYIHGDYAVICNSDGSATPTPVPTAAPSASIITPTPQHAQEASYTTLKLGSTGNAVKNLVTELKNQGYYTGTITNRYTSAVEKAVKAFQKAKSLTADGIAGSNTQHALFGTVPIGSGTTSDLTMTLYKAEKIDWFKGGINELWAKGANYKVYDVKTGIVWWAHRWSGGYHVDAEPLTAADTARLCRCYNVTTSAQIASKNLYQRRPCLVTIGTRTFACSLYGVPHNYPDGDTIPTNEFKGQVCIHFTNSWTHGSKKVDSGHEEAIDYAWKNAPNGHQ